jgi:hypothetical protein
MSYVLNKEDPIKRKGILTAIFTFLMLIIVDIRLKFLTWYSIVRSTYKISERVT